MKRHVRFPIRLKIMISMLFAITAVVSVITFTMANFFHDDKRSYVNDWISIAALSTAEEARSLLEGYAQRLELYSMIALTEGLNDVDRERLLGGVFENLPQLVEVTLYRDGEEIGAVQDSAVLEQAGLSREELQTYRKQHPLPVDTVLDGVVHIRNSTMVEALPTLTMAFTPPETEVGSGVVIAAVLRLKELQQLGARFKVFEISIVTEDGTLLAHHDESRVFRHEKAPLQGRPGGTAQQHQAGLTVEYVRNGEEMLGGFAGAGVGGVTVAAESPRATAYLASRSLLGRMMWLALGLLVVMAIAGRLWARRITRPVERLSNATRKIAKGEFEIRVDVESRDEIGALAGSFNQMATELHSRDEALAEAQSQLVQSEKLAAFGQLGAGIAHEVKNPLAGILGCAQLTLLDAEEGTPIYENVQLIEKETTRCKEIIDNLLRFARQEKALMEPTDVNAVVKDAAAIVNHQMEMTEVKVVKELTPEIPQIRGNGNQLQQVLMNLMLNAQQAMEGKPGTVTISTERLDDDRVELTVRDTGPGIPKEIQSKLFEPFFTTKPTGKGTGLGLSVSFGIVRDHGGEISIKSEIGHGAEFVIVLPVMKLPAAGGSAAEIA